MVHIAVESCSNGNSAPSYVAFWIQYKQTELWKQQCLYSHWHRFIGDLGAATPKIFLILAHKLFSVSLKFEPNSCTYFELERLNGLTHWLTNSTLGPTAHFGFNLGTKKITSPFNREKLKFYSSLFGLLIFLPNIHQFLEITKSFLLVNILWVIIQTHTQ